MQLGDRSTPNRPSLGRPNIRCLITVPFIRLHHPRQDTRRVTCRVILGDIPLTRSISKARRLISCPAYGRSSLLTRRGITHHYPASTLVLTKHEDTLRTGRTPAKRLLQA